MSSLEWAVLLVLLTVYTAVCGTIFWFLFTNRNGGKP